MATHPSILPGESHGQRSLVGYSPWGHKESDRMERLSTSTHKVPNKEGWVPKNTLQSPLGCKIKPVNPKRNQPSIFTGRTNAEAEAPILWPPDVKSQLTGKDLDAGND